MTCKSCLRCCFITVPVFLWTGLRLFGYVVFLSPMFVRFVWFYFVSSKRTVIKYGEQIISKRQTLDVYTPLRRRDSLVDNDHLQQDENSPPVIFFCCGGAWLIGYKMWGALLARFMCAFGCICVLPDYRNYPFGTIPDMVDDVEAALDWTTTNYNNVVAVGQSAGGHLLMVHVLKRALSNEPLDISGLVCLSAPLQLDIMQDTFSRHGMDDHFVNRIFDDQMNDYDPFVLLDQLQNGEQQSSELPPIQVYHGDADRTVPCKGSQRFYERLQSIHDGDTGYHVYDNWSHTDPILEGPADGDHRFHMDLVQLLHQWTGSHVEIQDDHRVLKRLCPHWMIQVARFCMPF